MRRQSQDEVTAAAARRLELLRRELERAGLPRLDGVASVDAHEPVHGPADSFRGEQAAAVSGLPEPAPVRQAGRHTRPGRLAVSGGWLQDRLPDTLRGRVGLAGGPVLLVLMLVLVAIVVSAVAVIRMGGRSETVPVTARSVTGSGSPLVQASPAPGGLSSGAGTGAGAASATPASGASASTTVTVDVAGKVRSPGVAVLPGGSRVVDALRRAGGARPGVDLSTLNLARVLVDGEQILVGRPAAAAPPGGQAGAVSGAAPPATGPLVNLNTATEAQLDTLPGVGPVTARKILQWRSANGAFSAVDELLEVDGIGEKTLAEIAPLVTL